MGQNATGTVVSAGHWQTDRFEGYEEQRRSPDSAMTRSSHSVSHSPTASPAPHGGGRVLHIVTRYLRGGSERRIADAMNALEEFDHDLVVGAESDVKLATANLPAREVLLEPTLVKKPSPYSDLIALKRMIQVIKERRPRIVFTHQSKAGVLGRIASRLAGRVPVVHSLSMASFGPGYSTIQSSVFKQLEVRLASSTTAYTVVGADLGRRFIEAGVPASKLHLIRSGVPLPIIAESREQLRLEIAEKYEVSPGRPWLIHVGSLEARKNVMLLPEVLRLSHELSPDRPPHLFIVGDGVLSAELKRALSRAGLERHSTMTGYVNGAGSFIKASDSLILLSSVEGLPQVLVQAASVGTPFAAFEVDGVREMLTLGARGTAVDPGDLESVARAVVAHLDNTPVLQEIDVGTWSPQTIRKGYRGLVREILSVPGNSPLRSSRS